MNNVKIKASKFLSLVLRHKPETIDLHLDPEGWASIQDLITKSSKRHKLSFDLIDQIVQENDKQRFAISEDGKFIRANQGHSVNVDLGLIAAEPPKILYHGTATRFLASIEEQGLQPQNRQHVHLSADENTALKVGQRHGKPVILKIPAKEMFDAGHEFFQAKNGVWLTLEVKPAFLRKWNFNL